VTSWGLQVRVHAGSCVRTSYGVPFDHHQFPTHPLPLTPMVLSDFILANVPLPTLPSYLTRWEPGRTPLSTEKEVVTALAVYLATIFGIQAYMKDKQPIKANGPFQVHNTFLYVGSGILLALILDEIVPIGMRSWWFDTICSSRSWTSVRVGYFHATTFANLFSFQKIEFYYMINYYFKYVELIDTVFLAIKKKPLGKKMSSSEANLCFDASKRVQLSFTCSITLPPHSFATLSSTGRPALSVQLFPHIVIFAHYFFSHGFRLP
jgi:hypothetical protein